MEQSETFFPRYAGTPAGFRHVGFRFPNGAPIATLMEMPDDWAVTVFVETDTYRGFIVGVSPDNEGLLIFRGLRHHAPKDVRYATAAEQSAALGGKTAATATPEELVEAARAELTVDDAPVAIVPEPLTLVPALPDEPQPNTPNNRPRRPRIRQFRFREQQLGGGNTRTVVDFHSKAGLSLVTQSSEGNLVEAFTNGDQEILFLFDEGTEYLLECATAKHFRRRRLEARSPKASHTGQTPQQVVEALAPSLATV